MQLVSHALFFPLFLEQCVTHGESVPTSLAAERPKHINVLSLPIVPERKCGFTELVSLVPYYSPLQM